MKIKGSFIQTWYCEGFTDERWDEELAPMSRLGMDLLIISDHKFDHAYVKRALAAAKRHGIKLCLGTGEFHEWWKKEGQKPTIVRYFHKTAAQTIELWNDLTDEERESVFGWYFVPEISSGRGYGYSPYLVEAMNHLIGEIEKTDKNLPLLFSPYFTEYLAKSMEGCRKDWVKILREVNFRPYDILCPQDSVGAAWTRFETLPATLDMYQSALKESGREIRFWLNCEDFAQSHEGKFGLPPRTENRFFIPCSIRRFGWQLELALRHTDTLVTFAYNHYHAPSITHPDYDRALAHYLETGEYLDNDFAMSEGVVESADGKLVYRFPEIQTEWAVQNVSLYRLDKKGRRVFVGRCDRTLGGNSHLPDSLALESSKDGSYEAVAFDVWGNESKPHAFKLAGGIMA